jgi:uncharacterized paraquat-inducible protein A
MVVLIILSVLISLGGLVLLTQATQGVGLICFACLLAIFTRIAQATKQKTIYKEKIVNKSEAVKSEHWQCPKCKNVNPNDVNICPKCGYLVE